MGRCVKVCTRRAGDARVHQLCIDAERLETRYRDQTVCNAMTLFFGCRSMQTQVDMCLPCVDEFCRMAGIFGRDLGRHGVATSTVDPARLWLLQIHCTGQMHLTFMVDE